MANELLDKGIKAAKSKDMPFAILYQGKNGSIGIATDENTAKKHCTEGNKNPKVPGSPMTGIVKWDKLSSEYKFETVDAGPSMETAMKAILERELERKVGFSCVLPPNNGTQQKPTTQQPQGNNSNGTGNAPPKIDPRMQRRLDEEQKKFEQRLGYSTEEQLNQKLSQIKAANAPIDKKKLAYDKLMSDITTETNKLKAETKLEDDQKEKIASRLRNAMQRASAQRNEEENASTIASGQQKAEQVSKEYDTSKESREQFQRDSIERRKQKSEGSKAVVNRAGQIAKPEENLATQFSTEKLTELVKGTEHDKSELQGVIDAAVAFQTADQNLREGKGTYAVFNKALNDVRQAADDYKKTHEKPSSSTGKALESQRRNPEERDRSATRRLGQARRNPQVGRCRVHVGEARQSHRQHGSHPRRPEKISLCRDRNQGLYRQDHQGSAREAGHQGRRDVQQA